MLNGLKKGVEITLNISLIPSVNVRCKSLGMEVGKAILKKEIYEVIKDSPLIASNIVTLLKEQGRNISWQTVERYLVEMMVDNICEYTLIKSPRGRNIKLWQVKKK